jgi:mono/diheme cytochrome c family protein
MKRKSIVLLWTFAFLLSWAYSIYYAREAQLEGVTTPVRTDTGTIARDDEEIEAAIKERYFPDSQVNREPIEIAVKNAEVTLRGQVSSDAARLKACELARETPGVQKVHDQMQVTPPFSVATVALEAVDSKPAVKQPTPTQPRALTAPKGTSKQDHVGQIPAVLGAPIATSDTVAAARKPRPADTDTFANASLNASENPDCSYFGPLHEKISSVGLRENLVRSRFKDRSQSRGKLSTSLTEQVAAKLPSGPDSAEIKFPFEPPYGNDPVNYANPIDRHIFSALQTAGVPPAKLTNDFEFIRRVSLDLTGRIPTKDRVLSFVADSSPDKRQRLTDELLGAPEWVDKWTMFFGDLYQNTQQNQQVTMYQEGVLAFNSWIRDSLANNKPYDQMARDLIMAQGTSSYQTGTINWLVGGSMGGGPYQDHVDARTARMAQHLLGLAHMNCVGCHDGAGHLDSLSLWGKDAKRIQFWQLASFLSHTEAYQTRIDPAVSQPYYWGIREDASATYQQDYRLNTTTGNRPPRQPFNGLQRVSPWYPFGGGGPVNENYRVALARLVTSDFQFARAAVNYVWREFFGIGIVDPPDFFDLARLDENNPPPAPWTLQPSHPALLRELAQDFISSGYDLKTLMRSIVTSRAYQLSSRYTGTWNSTWERLFARKLVRRLWGEELHDAIVQSSGILPSYNLGTVYGPKSWAMQFPDTRPVFSQFVEDFMNGNRDEEERLSEVSIQQSLTLMNNNVVMSRVVASNTNGLVARSLSLPNDQLVDHLFLTVLSRYPTEAEKSLAVSSLQTGTRSQKAENLLWSLYNKVDFIFNY